MDYLIYIILALVGFGYYNYQGRKKAETEGLVSNVKGQDKQLEDQQLNVKEEINKIDERIKKLKEQHQDQSKENKTLEELAAEARKNN